MRNCSMTALFFPIAILLILSLILPQEVSAFSNGPPTGRTGAPGEQTCIDGCHDSFTLNDTGGSASFSVSGLPAQYNLDTDYTISVTITRSGVSTFGFEAVAKETTGNTIVGTFTAGSGMRIQSGYIQHDTPASGSGGTQTWSFTWRSPSSNVGPIKIYAAGNAANGANVTQGDYIYTGSTSETILPVELASFQAGIGDDNRIRLFWTTVSETNNLGFEIQRSQDGMIFTVIGFVEGAGTVSEFNEYSFTTEETVAGRYFYRLKQIDFDGSFTLTDVQSVTVNAPVDFALVQNYPNPFNPETVIRYRLPEAASVTLIVYNLSGQMVRTLVDEGMPAGEYSVVWNGANSEGVPVASGVYLYRIVSGNFSAVRKLALVR